MQSNIQPQKYTQVRDKGYFKYLLFPQIQSAIPTCSDKNVPVLGHVLDSPNCRFVSLEFNKKERCFL